MKLSITAYKTENQIWAFDHEHMGTVAEALCGGTEDVLDWYFELFNDRKPNPNDKLDIQLSTENIFESTTTRIDLISTNTSGSDYVDHFSGKNLWLCPWLQGYFGVVPETLYVLCSKHQDYELDPEFEALLDELYNEEGA